MDNCLSVKRERIVLAAALNLVLVVCSVFVYIKLNRVQGIIPPVLWNEPGFREMGRLVAALQISLAGLTGFVLLYTANLAGLRIYYDKAGIRIRSLFRNWKTDWLQVELAYIGRHNLVVKSAGRRFSIPFRLLSGDLDKLVSCIPAGVLLDKDSATRQERKRELKILLAVMLAGIVVFAALDRYFKPYLSQVGHQMTQAIDKYKKQVGIKTAQKEDTK